MQESGTLNEEDQPPGTTAPCFPLSSGVVEEGAIAQDVIADKSSNVTLLVQSGKRFDIIKASARSRRFLETCFPGTSVEEWNDWRWQLRNRFTTLETLARVINFSQDETAAITRLSGSLPLAITPYYASLLNRDVASQGLRRSVVPVSAEFIRSPGEAEDPLNEDNCSPVPGIVHRYPDRVLFLVSAHCSTYCRYCTRSRLVGSSGEYRFSRKQWEQGLAYIESHREVRDVLLSGGDPLTLSDEQLEWLLSRLSRIRHVEFTRIGTKVPVVLPQRITRALLKVFKRYHPLWLSIHFTHPEELTPEVNEACRRLADAGIPLGSQTVLLKGINDDVEILKALFHGLLKIRVRPYYLYQCDPILGSAHFRTPVEKGIQIIQRLRGFTSGYAVPQFVIDAPGGGGKIPLLPGYLLGRDGDGIVLKNYEGRIFRYPDPA